MSLPTPYTAFEDRYIPVTESGCWLWLNRPMKNGYCVMYQAGKNEYAHRISWRIHRGPIPPGLCVLHSCDVTCCVNPDHLFLGTRTQNQQDMKNKHRSTQGSRNPMSKLTEESVKAIRTFTHLSTKDLALAARFTFRYIVSETRTFSCTLFPAIMVHLLSAGSSTSNSSVQPMFNICQVFVEKYMKIVLDNCITDV